MYLTKEKESFRSIWKGWNLESVLEDRAIIYYSKEEDGRASWRNLMPTKV
jgi:hypothetical protein